ncbi:MAG: CPBP family glutamic-type intramembrane protease, partial [Gammaproteobacteria bacterium]|nr:CPBP family glutamic-type intramembrane protease [Gammaproteobacteria bacterium]
LLAIVLAGAAHIVAEVFFAEAVALFVTGGIAIGFVGYLVWRAVKKAGQLEIWGMRGDNFLPGFRAQLPFAVFGVVVLIAYGVVFDTLNWSAGFWLTLLLYPIWGTAQQFALQNLIARNLTGLLSNPLAIAVAAAALFSVSHFPRYDLMFLTLFAGVFLTLGYRREPNLWAVGIVHGVLGSLAVYLVAEEDPGGMIIGALL